ncbi:hypothetical protein GCU67_09800 [Modestobacter muralis]|uniref:Uncharacterized protein n=1 Tax=Modestobacter muralis TaxID=1608614 RepID=A0A6P0EUA8_9ACTN|nr:hypothetical protein [Modestobacter muralis]NEK94463.1 hypothetical protein [Modestobacter muralis]NEN51351.1 hypothetical protein [Modestobacter muralis]
MDLEASDVRAGHLATIVRRALLDDHSASKHGGPIITCRKCAGDWGVAAAVAER